MRDARGLRSFLALAAVLMIFASVDEPAVVPFIAAVFGVTLAMGLVGKVMR